MQNSVVGAMTIQIRNSRVFRFEMRTRMPFRYGITTLTDLPHAFVRLDVEVNNTPAVGIAADHLPPKWFTKNPDSPAEEDIAEMLRVLHHALALADGAGGDSVWQIWREWYDAQARWGAEENLAPLLTNFGVSLVERALIDAVCRATGQTFAQALRQNTLGIRLDEIHPTLAGLSPADLLPAQPLSRIIARHTVGLSDPLTDADVSEEERLDDGLPQSLAACIQTYGLRHFKLKVGGNKDHDLERLHRIAEVIAEYAPADYAYSVDGNESYKTLDDFRSFWEGVSGSARLKEFLTHLIFVEQPLHRSVALSPEVAAMNRNWPEREQRPPLIIDESDATLESLPTALNLGYAGTSHKNCKGVFKGIVNACLLAAHRRQGEPALLTGEDLSNVGPVALLQDLTVMANLGIESVERNGHHYFAGLSMFPPEVQQQVLGAHPDLYHTGGRGWPTLTIEDGKIDLTSLNAAPFGVGFDLDVTRFTAA